MDYMIKLTSGLGKTRVKNICKKIVNSYVKNYTVKMTRNTNTYGTCRYYDKQIRLSYLLYQADVEEFKNTVLHEIAHAITNERGLPSGHNKYFYEVCKEIGARPKRRSSFNLKEKYTFTCPKCNASFSCSRLTYRIQNCVCRHCNTPVREFKKQDNYTC